MNAFAAKCIAVGVALLALYGGYRYVTALHEALVTAQKQAADARQGAADRDAIIKRLLTDADDKANQQRKLDADHSAIDSKLAGIRAEIRRYNDESAAFRAWAAGALPADVVRMHASPAITGAADYLARVPGGNALHAAGDGTDD
ncbi:Rz-like lysis system protein LysB [Paraburkholderia bryophila]|uniref:Rz-like lysis system protein LysB n=1 Tax=Paraburkholderia bryophila TaxID=420952 RepID=UPI0038BADC60